jgi:hypothetical protein
MIGIYHVMILDPVRVVGRGCAISPASRRIFNVAVGLVVSLAVACLTLVAGNTIAVPSASVPAGSWFQTYGYDQAAHSFYAIHTGALIVAAGCAALVIFSTPRGRTGPAWISLLLLAIAAPLSWLNYARPDFVLPDAAQAALDLWLLLLGILCAICVTRIRDLPATASALQAAVLGLVLFGAVLLPGFFVILWLCWISGLITESYFLTILWKWILEATIVVSVAIAGIYYMRKTRTSAPGQDVFRKL